MDPNQPFTPAPAPQQQPPQYSIDYLNQIAPQQKKSAPNKLLVIIGILAFLLVVTLAIAGLSQLGGPSSSAKLQTLAARLETLQKVADKAQPNIKSNQLRGTNSSLNLFLANANRDIEEPLGNNGIDIAKLDKAIVAREDGTELNETLEDARLNAVYDRTYAREMSYHLSTILLLMDDIEQSTNSKSLDEFITTTKANLEPVKEQMSDFTGSTS